jgi:hypothetical protein
MRILFEADIKSALALVMVSSLVPWRSVTTHHSNLHVVFVVVDQQECKSMVLGLSQTSYIKFFPIHTRDIKI